MAAMWRVVCVLLLLAVVTEAAKIETFNRANCAGTPTNTFKGVKENTCTTFEPQGAVRISGVSSNTRVDVYNQKFCKASDRVAQIYGDGCVVQGATKLKAVYIA